MKYLIYVLFIMGIIGNLALAKEWAINEKAYIEGFSELEQKQLITFKDKANSEPIAGATVEVFGEVFYTDKNGYVNLPEGKFKGLMHGYFPIKVNKKGYRELNSVIEIELEGLVNKFFFMEKGKTLYAKLNIRKNGQGTVYLNNRKVDGGQNLQLTGIAYGDYVLKRVTGGAVEEKLISVDRDVKNVDI